MAVLLPSGSLGRGRSAPRSATVPVRPATAPVNWPCAWHGPRSSGPRTHRTRSSAVAVKVLVNALAVTNSRMVTWPTLRRSSGVGLREGLAAWLAVRPARPRAGDAAALFLNARGRRLSARGAGAILAALGEDAGLDGRCLDAAFTSHVLRHTFGATLVRVGHDLVLVAERAGRRRLETARGDHPPRPGRSRTRHRLATDGPLHGRELRYWRPFCPSPAYLGRTPSVADRHRGVGKVLELGHQCAAVGVPQQHCSEALGCFAVRGLRQHGPDGSGDLGRARGTRQRHPGAAVDDARGVVGLVSAVRNDHHRHPGGEGPHQGPVSTMGDHERRVTQHRCV